MLLRKRKHVTREMNPLFLGSVVILASKYITFGSYKFFWVSGHQPLSGVAMQVESAPTVWLPFSRMRSCYSAVCLHFCYLCVSADCCCLLLCDLLLSFTWLADAAMAAAVIDVLRIWLVLMQQGKRGRAVSLLQYSKTISAPKASITFGHRSTYGMVLNTVSINMVFIRPLGWSQDLGHLKRSRIPANDEMATLEVVGFGL